ncbi:MAG: hypothetical protein MUE53_00230 [Chitinophagales bacterium]|jgi:hypothetical protein|nr:hypothetical protein [Chitinophagales bacterium]
MKTNRSFFYLFLLLIFQYSCNDQNNSSDSNPKISYTLLAQLNSETTDKLDKFFALKNGDSFAISVLDFYISDVSLSNASFNLKKNISRVVLLRLGKTCLDSSSLKDFTIFKGEKINFFFGLDDTLNASSPIGDDYSANNPLRGITNMYWDDWTKYRYIVFEGTYKRKNSSELIKVGYHLGGNFKYDKNLSQNIDINLDDKKTTEINALFNVDEFFFPTHPKGIPFTLTIDKVTHSTPNDQETAEKALNNLQYAISFN